MPMDTGYSNSDMQPKQKATNPTGKGGALGLLTSRLEQGMANKKRRGQMENMQANQGVSSRALDKRGAQTQANQGQRQDSQVSNQRTSALNSMEDMQSSNAKTPRRVKKSGY